MDKFVVKTPAVSSTEKASSHLPPNLTAHDRARKYPTGTFHVDDGLMFCSSCNTVIDHLRKSVAEKHLEKDCFVMFKLVLLCMYVQASFIMQYYYQIVEYNTVYSVEMESLFPSNSLHLPPTSCSLHFPLVRMSVTCHATSLHYISPLL